MSHYWRTPESSGCAQLREPDAEKARPNVALNQDKSRFYTGEASDRQTPEGSKIDQVAMPYGPPRVIAA